MMKAHPHQELVLQGGRVLVVGGANYLSSLGTKVFFAAEWPEPETRVKVFGTQGAICQIIDEDKNLHHLNWISV